jgi:hypothetical protein
MATAQFLNIFARLLHCYRILCGWILVQPPATSLHDVVGSTGSSDGGIPAILGDSRRNREDTHPATRNQMEPTAASNEDDNDL